MKIAKNTLVSMNYTLTSDEGEVIDSSTGREPLEYIQGQGMIVPGLEKEMEGHSVGDKFKVKVSPAEGYGEINEALLQEVPLNAFQGAEKVEAGMMFYAQTPGGQIPLTVRKVTDTHATVDANHALAGKNLNFEIEVVGIKPLTDEEIDAMLNSHCCGGEGHDCSCHEDGEECCGGHDDCDCKH
ncbi:MAG: peptidylprolyl isomerase [Fibrobacter sp.]|nr:peptidylprolyl isomerase [Fibrobacter sp.]